MFALLSFCWDGMLHIQHVTQTETQQLPPHRPPQVGTMPSPKVSVCVVKFPLDRLSEQCETVDSQVDDVDGVPEAPTWVTVSSLSHQQQYSCYNGSAHAKHLKSLF